MSPFGGAPACDPDVGSASLGGNWVAQGFVLRLLPEISEAQTECRQKKKIIIKGRQVVGGRWR